MEYEKNILKIGNDFVEFNGDAVADEFWDSIDPSKYDEFDERDLKDDLEEFIKDKYQLYLYEDDYGIEAYEKLLNFMMDETWPSVKSQFNSDLLTRECEDDWDYEEDDNTRVPGKGYYVGDGIYVKKKWW